MCGIIGTFNFLDGKQIVLSGLKIMENRGKDASKIFEKDCFVFGHNLHSIIDYVEQPIVSDKGVLVINCEIYNWKELNKKYNLNAKNDSELVLRLIEKKGPTKINDVINCLDGDYAFAYFSFKENKLILARDIIGVKPLVYSFNPKKKQFCFASEKKAFDLQANLKEKIDLIHLNPRQILTFDLKKNKIYLKNLNLLNKEKLKTNSIKQTIFNLLDNAIKKRIPENEFAVLLSGGIDSSVIAKVLFNQNKKFNSYIAIIDDERFSKPVDLEYSKQVAKECNSKLIINKVSIIELEKQLPFIISLIESSDPVRVGVASTIYFATKNIKEKVIFSGLGADEIFAGYNRFKNSIDVNKDCYSYLIKMYENDLYFEDIITMANKIELRVPFLDKDLVSTSLKVDENYKIDLVTVKNKLILREYANSIGLNELIVNRDKKAAQYGSNFDKAIEYLAKKHGFKSKSMYLSSLGKKKNISIGALLSTGKDSLYAINLMKKMNYSVSCLITIDSKNKDSFMFHTPTINLAKLQSKALGIPLIIVKTKGEKEIELNDLENAIKKAIKKYKIEGLVSGAIFSNYQRERIEKITENLGIRSFAPLWHMDQTKYMQRLIKENNKFIITKIACYGLDESYLGKVIDENDLIKLEKLNKKFGVNVAGEGGEFETLMIDMPLFNKSISIEFDKKLQNEFTGEILIKKVKLVKK
ncbi:MAG: diphthine--ammonia ligase [Candidatus ainarchaeum sp.]|nr:diphthine--ammonia ligase [Candidatus ainarchaeum sp.]